MSPRFIGPYFIPLEAFPTILEIQQSICREFGLTMTDLIGPRKTPRLARPRQIGMYLSVRLARKSLNQVGRKFGGRDHTTVMHAVRRITELRISDAAADARIRALEGRL